MTTALAWLPEAGVDFEASLGLGVSGFVWPLVIEEAPEDDEVETGVAGDDGLGEEKLGIEGTGVGGEVRAVWTGSGYCC